MSLDGWRYAPSPHCPHGDPLPTCPGNPAAGVAPCAQSEYVFCAHGVDIRKTTREGQPYCPTCRGITRRLRNADTWRPPRVGP